MLYFLKTFLFTFFTFDYHIAHSSKFTHIDPFDQNGYISSDCNFENCLTDTIATHYINIPLVLPDTQQPHISVDLTPPPLSFTLLFVSWL